MTGSPLLNLGGVGCGLGLRVGWVGNGHADQDLTSREQSREERNTGLTRLAIQHSPLRG